MNRECYSKGTKVWPPSANTPTTENVPGISVSVTQTTNIMSTKKPKEDVPDIAGAVVYALLGLIIIVLVIVGAVYAYKTYNNPSSKDRIQNWTNHGNDIYEPTRGKTGGKYF